MTSPGVRCDWNGCANPRAKGGTRCWIASHSGPEPTAGPGILVPPPVAPVPAGPSPEERAVLGLLEDALGEGEELLETRGFDVHGGCDVYASPDVLRLLEGARAHSGDAHVLLARFGPMDASPVRDGEEDEVWVSLEGWRSVSCEEDHGCPDVDDCSVNGAEDDQEASFHVPLPSSGLPPADWAAYDALRQWSDVGEPFTPDEAALAASSGWARVEELTPGVPVPPVTTEGAHLERMIAAAKRDGHLVTADVPVPLRARLGDDVYRVGASTLRTSTAASQGPRRGRDVSDEVLLYVQADEERGSVWSSVYVPLVPMTTEQAELYNRLRADGTPRVEAEFFALNV